MKTLKHLLLITGLFMGITHSASAQDVLSVEQQEQVAENVQQFIQNLIYQKETNLPLEESLVIFSLD